MSYKHLVVGRPTPKIGGIAFPKILERESQDRLSAIPVRIDATNSNQYLRTLVCRANDLRNREGPRDKKMAIDLYMEAVSVIVYQIPRKDISSSSLETTSRVKTTLISALRLLDISIELSEKIGDVVSLKSIIEDYKPAVQDLLIRIK